jgi:hypothetical protein
MPFLGPELLERYASYWQVNPSPPGMHIDPGGCSWSDIIGCGGVLPSFFVSQRILDDLAQAGIPIHRSTVMPIVSISAKRLKAAAPPVYHVLEADPGIEVDWCAMGIPVDSNNVAITNPYPKPWPPPVWLIRPSTWKGLDLFSYSNWQGKLTLLCTQRVVDLAKLKGWTNVRFERLSDGDRNRPLW